MLPTNGPGWATEIKPRIFRDRLVVRLIGHVALVGQAPRHGDNHEDHTADAEERRVRKNGEVLL